MTTKASKVVLGSGCVLGLASSLATAGYGGMEWELDSVDQILRTRVYAVMTGPDDRILSVEGSPTHPIDVRLSGFGEFYQHAFGSDLPPSLQVLDAFPSLAADTFVTIGRVSAEPGEIVVSRNWPGIGPTSLAGTNIGWFVGPDAEPAAPIDGRVLLGTFSAEDDLCLAEASFVIHGICNGEPFSREVIVAANLGGDVPPWEIGIDHDVDTSDLLKILSCWGVHGCDDDTCARTDVTRDGVVNVNDLLLVLANWGPW